MNWWIIGIIAVGLLTIAGVVVASVETVNADEKIKSCSECGNTCTRDNNCGLSSCGVVNGRSCDCGR